MSSRVCASAAALLAGVALTACSSSSGGSLSSGSVSANPAAVQSAMAAAQSAAAVAGQPRTSKQAALMAVIQGIDAALVAKPDKVITAAKAECSSISGGASTASLITSTKQRISTANVQLTDAQAATVLAAIKQYVCS